MQKGLVSILTPCYNAAHYISKLLDSVLNQDYPFIEMYIINDGSTDNINDIVSSYIPKFRAKRFLLSIINQDNSGQSAAIKNGLNYISGEFLVWPDSDDYYATNNAISEMVNVFNNNGLNIGIVRTREALLEWSSNNEKLIGVYGANCGGIQRALDIFKDCLLQENGFYYTPGAYMLRTEYFYKTSADFYVNKMAGQNVQLLLPILYYYDCYTIPKIHFNVVVHKDSHSRRDSNDFEKLVVLYNIYEETYRQTLRNIIGLREKDLNIYEKLNTIRYDLRRLALSCIFNRSICAKYYYSQLKSNHAQVSLKLKLQYFLLQIKLMPIIRLIMQRIKSIRN